MYGNCISRDIGNDNIRKRKKKKQRGNCIFVTDMRVFHRFNNNWEYSKHIQCCIPFFFSGYKDARNLCVLKREPEHAGKINKTNKERNGNMKDMIYCSIYTLVVTAIFIIIYEIAY
jgi:hypothetical protein